ncbi:unnamed protein product, partial [Symbiodinium sp. CCMP2456]
MAKTIPCTVYALTKTNAMFAGLKHCATAKYGTTGFSVYTLLNLMESCSLDLSEFKKQVKLHIPSLSDEETVFPYKRLENVARRVGRQSLNRIEKLIGKYHNADIYPASWWRDPKTLLQGPRHKKGQQCMSSATEQELFVARVLREAELAFQVILSEPEKASPLAIRKAWDKVDIPVARRTLLRESAGKFHKLFERSSGLQWSPAETEHLVEAFANGSEPEVGPPEKWVVVRQLVKKRKHEQQASELASLKVQREALEAKLTESQENSMQQAATHLAMLKTVLMETWEQTKEQTGVLVQEALQKLSQSTQRLQNSIQSEVDGRYSVMEIRKTATDLPAQWQKLIRDTSSKVMMF